MRRLPKDGRYPDFPSSDEGSEYAPSRTAKTVAKAVLVLVAVIIMLALCAIIVWMAKGIHQLSEI